MRTYTHVQGDIEKINICVPTEFGREYIIPVIVKFQERTIKYGGLDLLVLQIDSAKEQYLIVPGTIIGHKKLKGQKVSYIDPIIKSKEQDEIKEIIRNSGLQGCIHFWEEELEN